MAKEHTIRVNEMFGSIEGEGAFVGSGAVFLRLQGCPHKCPNCDTKRAQNPNGGREFGIRRLAKGLATGACRHLVITGGEPLVQGEALGFLVDVVASKFDRINIETSGLPFVEFAILLGRVASKCRDRAFRDVHVTWSPKSLHALQHIKSVMAEVHVGTVKLVWPLLGDPAARRLTLEAVTAYIESFVHAENFFIQPQWHQVYPRMNSGTYAEMKRLIMESKWRLSVQVHRFLGLR